MAINARLKFTNGKNNAQISKIGNIIVVSNGFSFKENVLYDVEVQRSVNEKCFIVRKNCGETVDRIEILINQEMRDSGAALISVSDKKGQTLFCDCFSTNCDGLPTKTNPTNFLNTIEERIKKMETNIPNLGNFLDKCDNILWLLCDLYDKREKNKADALKREAKKAWREAKK